MPDNQQMPVAEWLAEGKRRFGDDAKLWQFRCPVCGNIQTMEDFDQVGADPHSAYQECIGRHLPSRASNLAGTPSKDGKKSPCDYAAYGLFQFGWKVIKEAGKAVPVFPFADPPSPDLAHGTQAGAAASLRSGEGGDGTAPVGGGKP